MPSVIFKILSLLLSVGLFGSVACAQALRQSPRPRARPITTPRLEASNGQQNIVLGEAAQSALRAHDPSFRTLQRGQFDESILQWYGNSPNQLPQAVSADFNRDGRPDIALMGHSPNRDSVVLNVILSDGNGGFTVQEVQRWARQDDVNLWRDLGNDRWRITNWPYEIRLTEDDQIRLLNLPSGHNYLKWGSTGAQEQVYIFNNGRFRPAPIPERLRRPPSSTGGMAQ